jgi:hypothetical protein
MQQKAMPTRKLTLNIEEMQQDFFEDACLIGISSPSPIYRLCWLINHSFDLEFVREPELDVCVKTRRIGWDTDEEIDQYFPIYQYNVPLTGSRYLLYKLKVERDTLLPEVKNMDYLWMIRSSNPQVDADQFAGQLRRLPEIQMAQVLQPQQLKNRDYLLV